MSALDIGARGVAVQAIAAQPALMGELAARMIPPAISLLHTAGRSAVGTGAGSYISDGLCDGALLTAHPRFVFQTANGRIFRLLAEAGAITVEQGGAVGVAGTNDQPAIQATINYAQAIGAREVHFGGRFYELWCPQRTSYFDDKFAADGHPLVISKSLSLRGIAPERTTLSFKGLNGVDPVANWQIVDKNAGDGTDYVWRGGGLFVKGDTGTSAPATLTVDRVELHRLILQGNRTRTASQSWPASTATGDGWDTTDRAFWLQDAWVGDIICSDTDMIGWRGEIFCLQGSLLPARRLMLDRCRFLTTNADALNIGMPVPYVIRDCEFGDAYMAEESTGTTSGRYVNCVWRDSEEVWLGGAQAVVVAGYPYGYPQRNNTTQPPLISIEGGEFRNISGSVDIGSWTRGRFRMVDAGLYLSSANRGALQDIVLDVEMWLDQQNNKLPLFLSGPTGLTSQIAGAPAGTYYAPPNNVQVIIAARRTKLAKDNSRNWGRIQWNGYIDKSCRIIVDGLEYPHGNSPAATSYPPVSQPYVELRDAQFSTAFVPHGAYHIGLVDADTQITPCGPMANISGSAGGTRNITLATAPSGGSVYGYADRQRFRLYSNGGGPVYRFTPSASLKLMAAERLLYGAEDWIEFAYNQRTSVWEELGYFTTTQTEFNGSVTYDAPSIAAAGSTSTTVTATGAAVGDLVEAVSFGVSTAGLVVTAQVTAANTVTVWLYNPTAAAINLASTTVRVKVRKP